MSLWDGIKSLANRVNTVGYNEDEANVEGVSSSLLPELELSMGDEELVALSRKWIKEWQPYAELIEKKQKDNEDYWLGSQLGTSKETPSDNIIFEALETFLPIATRPKADPIVESDNTQEGNALADKVRKMLIYLSDTLSYNLKLKQVARYWALYMLGVVKVGWSMAENDVTCKAIRPQKLILDSTATIEECEYTGYYIGEYMEDMASDLILRFPKKEKYITDEVKEKMGTKIKYIMWSTDEYVFWTLNDEVLGKLKNPHWNYETKQESVDEFGQPTQQTVAPKNHYNQPKKPYVFLSIFNLGKHPHDDTNNILQTQKLQDLINKRLTQIDRNADNANGSLALSGDAFTEGQAKKAGEAKRKGGTIWVPSGPIGNAVQELNGNALPNFVYESLIDYRNEARNIFGTRGSSAQGTIAEKTVGGKNIIRSQDSDRIGGGVSTYLEQFSDHVFNRFVQLMYVYYDEPHSASVLGPERAKEYIALSQSDFSSKLLVGVKEGSMIPHDPMSERGEAIELWSAGALDPITFFDKLEFPNPRETAKQLYLWKVDPVALFPDLQAAQQAQAQQQAMQQQQQAGAQQQQQAQQTEGAQNHDLQKIALQGVLQANNKANAQK